MKTIKKLLILLLVVTLVPLNVFASNNLTIGNKSYEKTTGVLTISGTSTYNEVMVSIFDGTKLLAFKTVDTSSNNYTANFHINFEEDKTVTIKVGDINSEDYKIATLDVEKTLAPGKPSKVTDDQGNYLKYLDGLKKFENTYVLDAGIKGIDEYNASEQAMIQHYQDIFGNQKPIVAVLNLRVLDSADNFNEVPLEELPNGYELFLNISEQDLSGLTRPSMARLIDPANDIIEEGKVMRYNSELEGVLQTINNAGIYFLYEDLRDEYPFLDNTANQKYNIKKDDTLTLRVNGDFSKFLSVYVDDIYVNPSNYTATSGSTIITFTKAYLNSLSVGTHTVVVNFTDGYAETTITIENKVVGTGDNIMNYMVIFLLTSLTVGGVILRKKFARK